LLTRSACAIFEARAFLVACQFEARARIAMVTARSPIGTALFGIGWLGAHAEPRGFG
jgi:hypothetical protein